MSRASIWAISSAVSSKKNTIARTLPSASSLSSEAGGILLESTPRGLNLDDVRGHILQVPHVIGVHDLHASTIATGLPVLTAHVVVEETCFAQGHVSQELRDLQTCVAEHFDVSVEHSTFQIEAPSHSALERHSHH